MKQPVERRLAAILAADVAGYSRLMGADEEGTHQRLKAHLSELVEPKIKEHRGRIVKNTGDGMLVEFPSVVDAVRCAVAVQQAMPERNTRVAADSRIELRIGINLGDVIVEDGDIFGDGVNVAARLEALAEPGEIFVSKVVRDQVRDKLDFGFEDLGEQQVKNIARPVHVYRIPLAETARTKAPLPLPDKPSLAVLPFQNMTGDPEQDYFVDGIVEEITTAISRLPWLFVIARNSSFTYKGRAVDVKQVARELGVRYVLEGSVRKAGNRVRITGQLIDTATGAHIWADRFDGALDDIFELQDEVASGVAGAIEPKLRSAEIERAIRKPTENLGAYDLYLRALAQFWKWTPDGRGEAIDLLRRALAIDPSYAAAAGLFAWCRVVEGTRRLVSAQERDEGWHFARLAVEKGNEDPDALWMGGWGMLMLAGERAAGLSAMERSLALNPNSALAWCFFGWAQSYHRRSAPAIEALQRALRLSPLDPQPWVFYGGLAHAHFAAGRWEEAIEWADRALHAQPRMTAVVGVKAAACSHLGRIEEARACVSRYRELRPGSTIGGFSAGALRLALSPEFLAAYTDGLRKAGMPEE
jgi:TolB-like protein/class 3 adenylate cyclase/tetratricopeptide (TPR) repeat protein